LEQPAANGSRVQWGVVHRRIAPPEDDVKNGPICCKPLDACSQFGWISISRDPFDTAGVGFCNPSQAVTCTQDAHNLIIHANEEPT